MACACLGLVFALIAIPAAVKIFLYVTTGRYTIRKNLKGKHILITGGTGGIGKETFRELARNGATVHVVARNISKAESMISEFKSEYGNIDIHVYEADLSNFQSVRHFCAKFLATKVPIHIMINNAGLFNLYKKITVDGNEETCQANHLSHFLMTNLLLDRIIESGPGARIVNVSSMLHDYVKNFDVTDINFERRSHMQHVLSETYNWSKLENILFTRELARRLQGKGVTVNVLHPGAVKTDLGSENAWYHPFRIGAVLARPFLKTALDGAATTLYLAIADEVANVSGQYFSDCKPAATSLTALDDRIAQQLWKESERLTGLKK
jgi:NAD(P)-dependent dehydrogenase (short-subunit alcohol dehydrogenase family)